VKPSLAAWSIAVHRRGLRERLAGW